jgi:integrase
MTDVTASNNFRSRDWLPALKAAGLAHRCIYDMRHTFATWSLARCGHAVGTKEDGRDACERS